MLEGVSDMGSYRGCQALLYEGLITHVLLTAICNLSSSVLEPVNYGDVIKLRLLSCMGPSLLHCHS